jgi:GTP-binding protein
MSRPLQLQFLTSAAEHGQLGNSVSELAVAGRSNVGKSSLINALSNRNSLARTSKTPGATRLLNVYELAPEASGRWLVDLPGFGYAKASKAEQDRWARMIEEYLTQREQLGAVLLLVDGLIGPTDLDIQSIEWFDHIDLPATIIATKHDKVKPSKRPARKKELAEACGVTLGEVRWVSATKGTGIPELRTEIEQYLREES